MGRAYRILVVDDDIRNVDLLAAILVSEGHEVEQAHSGEEALDKLGLNLDLVLMDIMMPGMDGFETTRQIRAHPVYSDLPVIMVTSLTDKEDRLKAVEAGANDFIAKPIDRLELKVRSASLFKMKDAQDALKRHMNLLEETVLKRTAELRETYRSLEDSHKDTIFRLGAAAECKDGETGNHIKRVGAFAALLARLMDKNETEQKLVGLATQMHDVGKIGIPDSILLKPGGLTEDEWEVMKTHTTLGAQMLSRSSSEYLQTGELIALTHHEKWDGTGYPKGLKEDDIPLWGRICAVVDVFDALTSDRPYRRAMSNEKAVEFLKDYRGSHLDPDLVDRFLEHFHEVLLIQKKYFDSEDVPFDITLPPQTRSRMH